MTLLITLVAAVISTLVWYLSDKARQMKIKLLLYMFWGASLMWFVDSIAEYIEDRNAIFTPTGAEVLNDTFLGFSVVALSLMVWIAFVLIKDPLNTSINKEKT